MSTIFWDDRSPSDAGATRVPVLVWNLAPGSRAFVRFLGRYRGVWLHWVSHSVPCRGEGCPFCREGKGTFWMGYAPALLWGRSVDLKGGVWKPIVCPVTEEMAAVLRPCPLVGLVVELHRPGRRRNGAIECVVVERPLNDPLPPAFDVEPILRRMWRLRAPVGDVADGPPARLLPFPSGGDVPPIADGGAS